MAKILLVEDGEMNRNMLGHRLERRGYTVASAADGQWVLAMIEVQPFAAILLEEGVTNFQECSREMIGGFSRVRKARRVRLAHQAWRRALGERRAGSAMDSHG